MGSKEYIVVTGGAGYIGSHTVIELINNNYDVIVIDNLNNSCYDAIARVEYIVRKPILFFKIDLRNTEELEKIFQSYRIKGVIHFAGLKAVGESTKIPIEYYDNNVSGTVSLLKVMEKNGVKTLVFSSSATVYGDATRFENMIPIPEVCPTGPTNPYGSTKYTIENIIRDIYGSDSSWRSAILRYFNPIGAHPSGLIGENPLGIPNNLLPFLSQVAIGRREKLYVFGCDYNSHDGTPIRDYIHVVDLARGHIAALRYMNALPDDQGLCREWNLGTGKGSTVFDIYNAFCEAVGRKLPYEVVGRRGGDVLDLTANPQRAQKELNWKAQLSIQDACRDLWKWTQANPFGFEIPHFSWRLFPENGITDYKSRLNDIDFGDFKVSVANYGALIQSIKYNNRELILGFDDLLDYKLPQNPYFGSTVGRYANRISRGSFEIDGKNFNLTKNEGTNTLHGGQNGFDKQYFLGPVAKNEGNINTLDFVLVDSDRNDGFPATVEAFVRYTIGQGWVEVDYQTQIADDSPQDVTAVNLTNHTYWNINGGKSIDGTKVKTSSNNYLEFKESLPTGKVLEFCPDLSKGVTLTPDVLYDNCVVTKDNNWSLDTRPEGIKECAVIKHPSSPFTLTVESSEPSFQFYTGDYNNIAGFGKRSGLCIEPGRFTNAINVGEWSPQVILRKGQRYGAKFKYSLNKN